MGLKLADVAQQLPSIAGRIQEEQGMRRTQLDRAMSHIREGDPDFQGFSPPSSPAEYTVIATDGSQIDLDRNVSAGCYLINVGWAIISYGTEPGASLDKRADIRLANEGSLGHQEGDDEHQEARDKLNIGLIRSLGEFQRLAELVAARDPSHLCLAMVDGPLVLWGAAGASDQDRQGKHYYDGIVAAMESIHRCAQAAPLTLVGYTSYPGYRDVVRNMRFAEIELLMDRHIFERVLGPGQRSRPFKVESGWGPEHEIYFFYLKTDDEIARIELPAWVAEDSELLALAHAAILDQCGRGHGYPVALQEAHEQAVVTAADRQNFWDMVEAALNRRAMPVSSSAKSRSKRSRWL
ncbi:MAG: DNA double-strand break repair nuclease NurA [Dehalococcoidia bacterium]|nr:DNA double-strand break repair nuclease NurA [Dehalococcoidia bacterium]